ncbi:MAG: TIGR01777 family protein [Candidatus Eisenbacteria bacterium]|uniref:TIGR01777 family protein n=1 Tax=Eiseniibacteriota bacterium TaxID=2212470 RepID=A0A538TZT2_UNCEI|nr:MAG: TIGR01777 family protein [Candidatus Eisenbacteria bacterium]
MNVLVTGASGLIGTRLVPVLRRAGHDVARAVRRAPARSDEIAWTPETGALEPSRRFEAVVHLAGHSLASGRWTAALKRRAWSSRVDATRALCERLRATAPPPTFVCASAVGVYGDRGEEPLDETSPPGTGFLAELARAWEDACAPLATSTCRVVSMRLGLVLAREGGSLPRLLLPARLGLGGPLGNGRQFWSWVMLEDVLTAFERALLGSLRGPVNVVAPCPVRQRDFAIALGRAIHRPAFWPVPSPVLRAILGEMADAMILASARVAPRRLTEDGYRFHHPDLGPALRGLLGR